jgi:hypothetical protein
MEMAMLAEMQFVSIQPNPARKVRTVFVNIQISESTFTGFIRDYVQNAALTNPNLGLDGIRVIPFDPVDPSSREPRVFDHIEIDAVSFEYARRSEETETITINTPPLSAIGRFVPIPQTRTLNIHGLRVWTRLRNAGHNWMGAANHSQQSSPVENQPIPGRLTDFISRTPGDEACGPRNPRWCVVVRGGTRSMSLRQAQGRHSFISMVPVLRPIH